MRSPALSLNAHAGLYGLLAPFKEWREEHAAALAAWCIEHVPTDDDSDARFAVALRWLVARFGNPAGAPILTAYPAAMLARLSQEPAGTAYCSPHQLLPSSIRGLPATAKEVYERCTKTRRSRPSRERAAIIVASAIVGGSSRMLSLLELASWLLDDAWRGIDAAHPFRTALSEALPSLRVFPGDITEKLQALASVHDAYMTALRDGAIDQGVDWVRVEIHILNGLFAWPLLAATNWPGPSSLGFSLPLQIGAEFDADDVEPQLYGVNNGRLVLAHDWHQSADVAACAARDLWRKECGYFGAEWAKRVVQHATVVVDVSPAEAILAEFAAMEASGERFTLVVEGRSVDLCFALQFFSHLRGLHYPLAFAASGMLSNPLYYTIDADSLANGARGIGLHALDRDLVFPFHVSEKLRWVDAAGVFDMVIHPKPPPQGGEPAPPQQQGIEAFKRYLKSEQRAAVAHKAEINECKKLSNAADSAFAGSWRRWQLIRCAHLHIHLLNEAPSDVVKKGQELLDMIAACRSAVLIVPSAFSLIDVAHILVRLNSDEERARIGRDQVPPMLGIAVVRLVPDEGGDSLCGVLCELAGAPRSMADAVSTASGFAERAKLLAEVLNHNDYDPAAPGWRPPDILVLALPRAVLEAARDGTLGTAKPDAEWSNVVAPLLDPTLASSLKLVADPRWGPALGSVRVVLVADDTAARTTCCPVQRGAVGRLAPAADDQHMLERSIDALSIFRDCFTQQEASVLLAEAGVAGPGVRSLLQRLQSFGLVHEVPGAWVLADAARKLHGVGAADPREMAHRHWAAAVARAPYIAIKRLPGLANFEARKLHRVHEALFHLRQAISLREEIGGSAADKEVDGPAYTLLRACYARVRVCFGVCGWDLAHTWLPLEGLPPAHREGLLEELYRTAIQKGKKIETTHVVGVLRLVARQMHRIEQKHQTHWAARTDREWQQLAGISKRILLDYVGIAGTGGGALLKHEQLDEVNLLTLCGIVSGCVISSAVPAPALAELDKWLDEAVRLYPESVNAMHPEWLSYKGDRENNDLAALVWYRHGYKVGPGFAQNWVKAVGCCDECKDSWFSVVMSELAGFMKEQPEMARRVLRFAGGTRIKALERHRRWRRGCSILSEAELV